MKFFVAAFVPMALFAQSLPTVAPELTVTARPLAPVGQVGQDSSIATGLQSLPGIIVLPQGLPGGQADFSIRGSNFSGAGLSLSGLSLRNPQTEHFHAELPFPGHWLGTPRVLTGAQQAQQTEGHLTGTVALSPLPIENKSLLTAGADNKHGLWSQASVQKTLPRPDGSYRALGAFAGALDIPAVDFPDNDVRLSRGGLQLQHHDDENQGDLWIGHQDKSFGARGYYGVNPSFKAEENTRDTLVLGAWRGPAHDASLLFREFLDDYKLHLPSSLYHNEHRSRSLAAQAGSSLPLSSSIELRTRIAADREEINSSALGDFSRSRLALTALPAWSPLPSLRLIAGARGELLEGDDDRLLPIARIEADATETLLLHAEYSQSVRRPSYTELNYESPGSLGNSGLGLQDQESIEAGLAWSPSHTSRLSASLFHQRTFDTVDWIRPDPSATRWLASNIGRVDTSGLELACEHRLHDSLRLAATWLTLDKDNDAPPYSSRYSLDYARHFASLTLDWTPTDKLRLEATQFWRDQAENALRDAGGSEQWLSHLAAHFRLCPSAQLSLIAANAFADDYRLYPGQDTFLSRRISAALTLEW